MKKILLLLFLFISISCKSDDQIQPNQEISLQPKSAGEIIKHTYYTLAYSEENEEMLKNRQFAFQETNGQVELVESPSSS